MFTKWNDGITITRNYQCKGHKTHTYIGNRSRHCDSEAAPCSKERLVDMTANRSPLITDVDRLTRATESVLKSYCSLNYFQT